MKTLTGRLMTALACVGLLLSSAAHAGGIDVRIPGVDVRLPAPPLPRVTIVAPEPEVRFYNEPRHYAPPPPPPRYHERRYYDDRDYDRRGFRDDRDYHRRYHHHYHDRHGW